MHFVTWAVKAKQIIDVSDEQSTRRPPDGPVSGTVLSAFCHGEPGDSKLYAEFGGILGILLGLLCQTQIKEAQ